METKRLYTFTGQVKNLTTPYGSFDDMPTLWRIVLRLYGFAPSTLDIETDFIEQDVADIAIRALKLDCDVAFDAETDEWQKLTEEDVLRNFRIVDRSWPPRRPGEPKVSK